MGESLPSTASGAAKEGVMEVFVVIREDQNDHGFVDTRDWDESEWQVYYKVEAHALG